MKGIILAGGRGTRLYPSTTVLSKQLIPVFDKPMIYYPLSILMLAGIREILIISNTEHLGLFKKLFKSGSDLGLKFSYKTQEEPRGLADAFLIGEDFIAQDSVCLILGDNIFYGHSLVRYLKELTNLKFGARIFGYYVNNPERFGVVELDKSLNVLNIQEKPKKPKSNYAVPGLYFFDNQCIKYAKELIPSERGEIEITSVIEKYIEDQNQEIKCNLLGRGIAWFDTGTYKSLLEATNFIYTIEKRQGLKVACLEEIAYAKNFIKFGQLENLCRLSPKSEYKNYLNSLIERIKEQRFPINKDI